MTGGQALDGGITVGQIARQMAAEGVSRIVVVTDEPDKYPRNIGFPLGTAVEHRSELGRVQKELSRVEGVTVMIYDQTCAAEKRRRRKRGLYPDPPKRAFINTAVCEGCGDCGEKSNCVAIVPVETAFGRKRTIDQSTCNKDFSCVEGFCPSFVTVHGGGLRRPEVRDIASELAPEITKLPTPELPELDGPWSIVVTGVGGTGVVTISAILGQAAHIDGLGFGSIDMAGLAQKGGAVACHVRIANKPEEIHSIRAGLGGADAVLGCDLVVTGSHKVLETIRTGHTKVALNSHEMVTGDFTRNPELELPAMRLRQAISATSGDGNTHIIDAHHYAMKLFGDSIASNMFMLGLAWQRGMIPVSADAIVQAIELNGAAIAMNQRAFQCGRIAAEDISFVDELAGPREEIEGSATLQTLDELIAHRHAHLTSYQDRAYADRYEKRVRDIAALEARIVPGSTMLAETVASAYAKILSYKDEYEVARLFTAPEFANALREQFDGDYKLEFHLAPPFLSERDPETGHLKKRAFGPWMLRAFRLLAKFRQLRGTRWDVFGYTEERKSERQAITDYEASLQLIAGSLTPENHAIAIELAGLPRSVRGFGHVKERHAARATLRAKELIQVLRTSQPSSHPERDAA